MLRKSMALLVAGSFCALNIAYADLPNLVPVTTPAKNIADINANFQIINKNVDTVNANFGKTETALNDSKLGLSTLGKEVTSNSNAVKDHATKLTTLNEAVNSNLITIKHGEDELAELNEHGGLKVGTTVVYVSNSNELIAAVNHNIPTIILNPGTYDLKDPLNLSAHVALIARFNGTVIISSEVTYPFNLKTGDKLTGLVINGDNQPIVLAGPHASITLNNDHLITSANHVISMDVGLDGSPGQGGSLNLNHDHFWLGSNGVQVIRQGIDPDNNISDHFNDVNIEEVKTTSDGSTLMTLYSGKQKNGTFNVYLNRVRISQMFEQILSIDGSATQSWNEHLNLVITQSHLWLTGSDPIAMCGTNATENTQVHIANSFVGGKSCGAIEKSSYPISGVSYAAAVGYNDKGEWINC